MQQGTYLLDLTRGLRNFEPPVGPVERFFPQAATLLVGVEATDEPKDLLAFGRGPSRPDIVYLIGDGVDGVGVAGLLERV